MKSRTVRVEYPIEDSTLPAPHLRLLARAMLTDHLDSLGVVAVSDVEVRVATARRVVVATVQVAPRGTGAWHPSTASDMCPNCHAILSGTAA